MKYEIDENKIINFKTVEDYYGSVANEVVKICARTYGCGSEKAIDNIAKKVVLDPSDVAPQAILLLATTNKSNVYSLKDKFSSEAIKAYSRDEKIISDNEYGRIFFEKGFSFGRGYPKVVSIATYVFLEKDSRYVRLHCVDTIFKKSDDESKAESHYLCVIQDESGKHIGVLAGSKKFFSMSDENFFLEMYDGNRTLAYGEMNTFARKVDFLSRYIPQEIDRRLIEKRAKRSKKVVAAQSKPTVSKYGMVKFSSKKDDDYYRVYLGEREATKIISEERNLAKRGYVRTHSGEVEPFTRNQRILTENLEAAKEKPNYVGFVSTNGKYSVIRIAIAGFKTRPDLPDRGAKVIKVK